MRAKFTQSSKIQAVEKGLLRAEGTKLDDISNALDVGCSMLDKWITLSRDHENHNPYSGSLFRTLIIPSKLLLTCTQCLPGYRDLLIGRAMSICIARLTLSRQRNAARVKT